MTPKDDIPERLIIAIGGNAIHPEGTRGTAGEQQKLAAVTGEALFPLMALGQQLIITHGNGPVVGKTMMRKAMARERVEPMPLDTCGAP